MAAGLRARVPVAFEDVLVRFSPEEWAALAEWQRELYWAVMKENYALVAWLGSAGAPVEVAWKVDEDEEPNVGAPRGKRGGGVPQPPSVGSDEARSDGWVAARGQAGPCVWAPRVSGVPLHRGQVCERQSDQRPAQVPVAFEDVEVRFSPEEWAALAEWQRELYWAVMKENYELVAWLGTADPRPESSGEEPQEGEIPEPPSTGDGVWAEAEELPGGGAAGVPVPPVKVPNTCLDCGQSFSERGLLIVHVLRTHLGERHLPCGECGKLLSGRGRLAAHQSAHLRERTFTCVACARSFVYHRHVVDQVRMELAGGKPFKCTKCSNRLVLMVEPGPPFPCPHCPKVFPTAYLLQRHQPRHTGEAAFPCAQCGQRFHGRGSLAIHLRAHARPLLHPCAQCAQRFGSKRALLAHQRDHAPDRPCRECGQVFGSRKARTAHRLEHERQRPFTCAECGKGFRRQDRYTLHQRLHAGPPPLACPQCSQRFRLPLQLERHQRLHRAPQAARLRARAQACPAGELGPMPGPASPSAGDPGPGPSPAWAVGSPPGK